MKKTVHSPDRYTQGSESVKSDNSDSRSSLKTTIRYISDTNGN